MEQSHLLGIRKTQFVSFLYQLFCSFVNAIQHIILLTQKSERQIAEN